MAKRDIGKEISEGLEDIRDQGESDAITPERVIESLIELKLRIDINIDELLESGKLVPGEVDGTKCTTVGL